MIFNIAGANTNKGNTNAICRVDNQSTSHLGVATVSYGIQNLHFHLQSPGSPLVTIYVYVLINRVQSRFVILLVRNLCSVCKCAIFQKKKKLFNYQNLLCSDSFFSCYFLSFIISYIKSEQIQLKKSLRVLGHICLLSIESLVIDGKGCFHHYHMI